SDKEYTQKQIDEFFNAPDWFPGEHPPLPKTVQFGKSPRVQACGKCHLVNGQGHPESASLTGLSAAYMVRQMAELKKDIRKNAEPMNIYAKNLSDEEVREAREYFPSLKHGGGGRTIACSICHGPDLRGLGEVPRIAGRHAIYIVRQLFNFKNGHNGGPWSLLMKAPVSKLTDEDIVSIAAYVGSLAP